MYHNVLSGNVGGSFAESGDSPPTGLHYLYRKPGRKVVYLLTSQWIRKTHFLLI